MIESELFEIKREELKEISARLYSKKMQAYSGGGSSEQAYQFIVTFLNLFYRRDFSEKELEEIITDCSVDGGIDAVYFGKEYIDIFDFKEVNGISDKDLETIKLALTKYIPLNASNDFLGDEAIKLNIKKISNKINNNKKIRFILVRKKLPYTKKQLIEQEEGNPKILSIVNSIESMNIPVVFTDIPTCFKESLNINNDIGRVILPIEKDLFAKNRNDSKNIIAKISLKNIFEIIEKHGQKIFNKNIRGYLGKKEFAKKICETLNTSPEEFYLYHNGITLTCSKIEPCKPNATKVTLTNPQIVNGAQSVYSLYRAYKDGILKKNGIKKAGFICKIIEADDDFTRKICETSNTQNTVKAEDLRSNDDIQILLEEYIRIQSKGLFSYKRKKSDINKNKIISTKLFQWVYAAFLEQPASAKNEKQFLFDIVTTKGQYLRIEKVIKQRIKEVWYLCQIAMYVEKEIRQEQNKKKKSFLRHADLHLITGLFYVKSMDKKDFTRIYMIFKKYYQKKVSQDSSLNENKIFTKDSDTWKNNKLKL